jgi:hypothetical protein
MNIDSQTFLNKNIKAQHSKTTVEKMIKKGAYLSGCAFIIVAIYCDKNMRNHA